MGFPHAFAARGELWVTPTAHLPWVAVLHVGLPHDFAAHGLLWVTPLAHLPWVALIFMSLALAFAACGVLLVPPTVILLQVACYGPCSHLNVGLLICLLLWDCGLAPDEVSTTLVAPSSLKSPVKGTGPGLSPRQSVATVLGWCLQLLHMWQMMALGKWVWVLATPDSPGGVPKVAEECESSAPLRK